MSIYPFYSSSNHYFFLNITSNSSYACSSLALVMSELAAAPPEGPDAALASARVSWLARAPHAQAIRRTGLRSSQMAGLSEARASKAPHHRANLASKPCRKAALCIQHGVC